MKHLLLLVLCLALVAGNAWALEVQPLPEELDIPGLPPQQDCTFGNTAEPQWYVPADQWTGDWIWIKTLFWPPLECACEFGFHIDYINVALYVTGSFSVPVTFPLIIDLEDGWWRDDEQCWYPGVVDCETEHLVTVQSGPQVYRWMLPLEDCPCAMMEYEPIPHVPGYDYGPYLISVRFPRIFEPATPAGIFPMTSDDPDVGPCTSFYNQTLDIANFEDLYGRPQESYGDWVISASATCCENPVNTESSTWGDVKSLFR